MEKRLLSIEDAVYQEHKEHSCPSCDLDSPQMSGWFDNVTDWASEAWDGATKRVSSSWEWAKSIGENYWNEAVNVYNQGQKKVEEKIDEARYWVEKTKDKQKEVDAIIAATKDQKEKQNLIEKRDEARGIFSEYVIPLFDQLMGEKEEIEKEYDVNLGEADRISYQANASFGAFPLIPLALGASMVSVAMAVIYYSKKAFEIEDQIINDSTLSIQEKMALIERARKTSGLQSIAGGLTSLKWPLIIGGSALIAVSLAGMKK